MGISKEEAREIANRIAKVFAGISEAGTGECIQAITRGQLAMAKRCADGAHHFEVMSELFRDGSYDSEIAGSSNSENTAGTTGPTSLSDI